MPGKVNPVIPEVVIQVGAQVIGNDTAITVAGTQGQFGLNVRIPLIAKNLLQVDPAAQRRRPPAGDQVRRWHRARQGGPEGLGREHARRCARSTRTSVTTRPVRSSRRPSSGAP